MTLRSRGPIARHAAVWVLAGALVSLTACGTARPPAPPEPAAPPPAAAQASVPVLRPTGAAVIDSGGPSPEALSVLASIPEPLSLGERVPPPAPGSLGQPAETPPAAAARDTTVGETPGAGGEIPVPEPTTALGQRPPARPARDTSAAGPMKNPPAEVPAEPPRPVVAAPPTTPPPAEPPPAEPPPARPPGDCWRVQVVASSDRAAVERVRMAAESVLSVPMVVEEERSLFKARSRECMDPQAADELKRRAIATGFPGSFRFVDRSP